MMMSSIVDCVPLSHHAYRSTRHPVCSRHRRDAEEALVRRREPQELAGCRRRHQEEFAQTAPGWRDQDSLSRKYRQGGGTLKELRG